MRGRGRWEGVQEMWVCLDCETSFVDTERLFTVDGAARASAGAL